jgi:hypothetical protein
MRLTAASSVASRGSDRRADHPVEEHIILNLL